jgi:hypothetical protein
MASVAHAKNIERAVLKLWVLTVELPEELDQVCHCLIGGFDRDFT